MSFFRGYSVTLSRQRWQRDWERKPRKASQKTWIINTEEGTGLEVSLGIKWQDVYKQADREQEF